jgi:hypothetical protein
MAVSTGLEPASYPLTREHPTLNDETKLVQAERFELPMSSKRILIYSQVQPTVSVLACEMEEGAWI